MQITSQKVLERKIPQYSGAWLKVKAQGGRQRHIRLRGGRSQDSRARMKDDSITQLAYMASSLAHLRARLNTFQWTRIGKTQGGIAQES